MSEKIVQLNEEVIKGQLKELVRGSVEETLNELLEAEAQKLTQAARYERNEQRQVYRSGHYSRNLTTTSGDVTLKVPKLKGISFETAIIERNNKFAPSKSPKCLKTQVFRGFCRFHWLQLGYIERAFCSQTAQGVRASSCLATSACLFGYRWLYVSIVVCTFS